MRGNISVSSALPAKSLCRNDVWRCVKWCVLNIVKLFEFKTLCSMSIMSCTESHATYPASYEQGGSFLTVFVLHRVVVPSYEATQRKSKSAGLDSTIGHATNHIALISQVQSRMICARMQGAGLAFQGRQHRPFSNPAPIGE
jgi:hypothetical protein